MSMIDVHLYGSLGKRFGRKHRFDISTPAEAFKALDANFPGFIQAIGEHDGPGFEIWTGKVSRDLKSMGAPCGRQTMRIIPVAAGAKERWVQIVAGVALVLLTRGSDGGLLGAGLGGGQSAIAFAGAMNGLGYSMAISGVAQTLFPSHDAKPGESAGHEPSYAFDGPVNTTAMGQCVPVGYGELSVGGAVISFGIDTENIYWWSGSPNGGTGGGSGPGGSTGGGSGSGPNGIPVLSIG